MIDSSGHAKSNLVGMLWMLAAAISFTAMMTLVKYLGADYSAPLQSVYRQIAGILVLLPLILHGGRAAVATHRPGLLFWRSVFTAGALILSFYSYQELPLADANALSFTRTLWVVPLAAVLLHERVGGARAAATLVGFGGVLLMLRPGGMEVGWPQLSALAAALMFAFTILMMKSLLRDHSPITIMIWTAVTALLLTMPLAIASWRWPGPFDLLLLFSMGALGVITQSFYLRALAIGETTAVVPVDYTRLVFAALVGYSFFHEIPDGWTITGSAIVVGATLFISYREHLAARQRLGPEALVDGKGICE